MWLCTAQTNSKYGRSCPILMCPPWIPSIFICAVCAVVLFVLVQARWSGFTYGAPMGWNLIALAFNMTKSLLKLHANGQMIWWDFTQIVKLIGADRMGSLNVNKSLLMLQIILPWVTWSCMKVLRLWNETRVCVCVFSGFLHLSCTVWWLLTSSCGNHYSTSYSTQCVCCYTSFNSFINYPLA